MNTRDISEIIVLVPNKRANTKFPINKGQKLNFLSNSYKTLSDCYTRNLQNKSKTYEK